MAEEKVESMGMDMTSIANNIRKKYSKLDPRLANKIGNGSNLKSLEDGSYIEMPQWWKDATRTKGLPFGRIAMWAGDSDSGKSSTAIMIMKSAVEQGHGVIYVETEGKTTTKDFECWGVDPKKILLIQSAIAEEAFQLMFEAWDAFQQAYPDKKLLVVYDSLGNTVSMRDTEIDLVEDSQKPGGNAKINRLALNKLIAKTEDDNVAVFIINYTYDNIGSPGKTNAGGKAVNFFSSLTYQTSRKRWLEKTVKGEKVRVGAEVCWKLFKNHIDKQNPGPKEVLLQITADGITCVGASENES